MNGMKILRLLLGIGFTVAGLALGAYVVSAYAGNAQVRNWPQTKGQIVHSEFVVHKAQVGPGQQRDRYGALVRYKYEVEGIEQTSGRVSFGWESAQTRTSASDYVQRYPQGRSVTVYYDPADPSSAVLERGVPSRFWLTVAGAAIFLLLGIASIHAFLTAD